MSLSTIANSHYRQLLIANVALFVHQLFIWWLVDCCPPWYGLPHILSNAASESSWFGIYRPYSNVHPGSYFQRLHCHCCGGICGVCIAVVSERVEYWMKHLSVSWIWICWHLAEAFVEPWFAHGDKERKRIMDTSWKFWGIYSAGQVKMESVAANFNVLLRANPTVYSSRLQWFQKFHEMQ